MKIYLVIHGDYSAAFIFGIYRDYDLAQCARYVAVIKYYFDDYDSKLPSSLSPQIEALTPQQYLDLAKTVEPDVFDDMSLERFIEKVDEDTHVEEHELIDGDELPRGLKL